MASADNATQKTIVLMSSDGKTFEVEEAVALKSETIKKILADSVPDALIPLPNVSSDILAKVIEYLKYHTEAAAKAAVDGAVAREVAAKTYLRDFDTEFLKVDQTTLFELIMAANFLDIKSLLDLTCQTAADMIKGKTPAEIRKAFNLAADAFSPEEEEEVRRMNAWAFE